MSLGQLEQPAKGAQASSGQLMTATETRLSSLSRGCSKVANELVVTLDKIGVNDKRGRMDTILKGFRAYYNTSAIDDLNARINVYRTQLAMALVISMRNHVTLSLTKQDEVLHQLTALRKEMNGPRTRFAEARERGAIDSPGIIIMDYLSGFLKPDVEHEAIRRLHDAIDQVIKNPVEDFKDWDNVIGRNYPDFRLSQTKESSLRDQIIEDLRFREMDYRESAISEAHRDTFKWIFEESDEKRTGFTTWLQSDSNLYWIAGKAGSGKSTLMKFIDTYEGDADGQKSRCRTYLEDWADGKTLVVASFYFWASGSHIEASQRGLIQTLLYQLLQQSPDIIPMVIPKIWESACLFGLSDQHWSNSDWICLFVDGLDEFEGNPKKLLEQLKQLIQLPNVKLCVSSRPWLVFEDAFNQKPTLMLQNLTYTDLRHFVVSEFDSNEGFKRLQIRDPSYAHELMDNITDKASGVFLWVKLVVKSLLAGLTYDDRISDLKRRLDALPADLEKLYVAILDDLDPFYFEHASQYFKLMMAARSPPAAVVFSFADEEDPEFAPRQPVEHLEEDQVNMRIMTTRRRLNSRCKGLLELGPENRVQFLHRSVKDYLVNQDIQHRLEEVTGDFDAHLKYCAAYLSVLKARIGEDDEFDRVRYHVKLCLFAAAGVSKNKSLMVQYLDALKQFVMDTLSPDNVEAILGMVPDVTGVSAWSQQSFGTSFLALAVRFGVTAYIAARVPAGCMAEEFDRNASKKPEDGKDQGNKSPSPSPQPHLRFRSILYSSSRGGSRFKRFSNLLGSKISSRKSKSATGTWPLLLDASFGHSPRVDMFKCLFEHGADCNVVCGDTCGVMGTPWTIFLEATFVAGLVPETWGEWYKWMPTLRLFMEHGAKASRRTAYEVVEHMQRIRTNTLDGEQAYSVLRSVLDGNEELALLQLRGLEH
ncbi:hypothetical protein Daus18300_004025 [Diaporthe australafricana]|uniref:NACHT domain-containing protein n=1 Tax=Diaporthe australafricana TaxID=127596 RepID=A0ABR3XB82_9PEZI